MRRLARPADPVRAVQPALVATVGLVLLAVVRVVLSRSAYEALVVAYGTSRGLDMSSFLGQQVAHREAPSWSDPADFVLLASVVLFVLLRVLRWGSPLLRWGLLGLCAVLALVELGSLGTPATWWYHVVGVVAGLVAAAVGVAVWRVPPVPDRFDRMHLRVLARSDSR